MSATVTETQAPHAPEITVLTRVASIPMISTSWGMVNDVLSSNAYTRSPYFHAKGLSTSAYKLTEPIQVRLAPLIVRADSIANKAVDVVENRYPYPFKAQPEEVVSYVRERRKSTTDYMNERVSDVNKVIDDKVKTPALNVAQDIDQVRHGVVCSKRFSHIILFSDLPQSSITLNPLWDALEPLRLDHLVPPMPSISISAL